MRPSDVAFPVSPAARRPPLEKTLLLAAARSWTGTLAAASQAERLVHDWFKRGNPSRREAAKLVREFITQARQGQVEVQEHLERAATRAVRHAAAATRRQVEDLQAGLARLSRKLKALETAHPHRTRGPRRTRASHPSARPRLVRKPAPRRKAA